MPDAHNAVIVPLGKNTDFPVTITVFAYTEELRTIIIDDNV